jgi:hypothetical protein
MALWNGIRRLFAPRAPAPPDARKLDGTSAAALAHALRLLPSEERGWITFAEARSLFSRMSGEYAFGEMDEEGKSSLASFAAESEHRSRVEFMPMEGRVYFVRKPS